MNKEVKLVWLLAVGMLLVSVACRKPAYSEIDTNRSRASQNQNAAGQAGAAQITADQTPEAGAAQPPPQAFKRPTFLDAVTGDIKDLPAYPGANKISVQFGPMQGSNFASFVLQTGDPMDKITAYYERIIKSNNWTVTDKTIDPELSEWALKKGENDSASVKVKKDPQSGRMNIVIVRGEKLPDTAK